MQRHRCACAPPYTHVHGPARRHYVHQCVHTCAVLHTDTGTDLQACDHNTDVHPRWGLLPAGPPPPLSLCLSRLSRSSHPAFLRFPGHAMAPLPAPHRVPLPPPLLSDFQPDPTALWWGILGVGTWGLMNSYWPGNDVVVLPLALCLRADWGRPQGSRKAQSDPKRSNWQEPPRGWGCPKVPLLTDPPPCVRAQPQAPPPHRWQLAPRLGPTRTVAPSHDSHILLRCPVAALVKDHVASPTFLMGVLKYK